MTLSWWAPLELLGQMSRWSRLGDGLRSAKNPLEFRELLPLIVSLGVVALIVGFVHWHRQRNDMSLVCDDPQKLFRELCLAHNIRGDRLKLLRMIAQHFDPVQPARIFLAPEAFQSTALPPSLQKHAPDCDRLRRDLFGGF